MMNGARGFCPHARSAKLNINQQINPCTSPPPMLILNTSLVCDLTLRSAHIRVGWELIEGEQLADITSLPKSNSNKSLVGRYEFGFYLVYRNRSTGIKSNSV